MQVFGFVAPGNRGKAAEGLKTGVAAGWAIEDNLCKRRCA